jgi:hypothetical protein
MSLNEELLDWWDEGMLELILVFVYAIVVLPVLTRSSKLLNTFQNPVLYVLHFKD